MTRTTLRVGAWSAALTPSGLAPSGLVSGAIILAGFVISLTVNWPGHLSYDSVVQLSEGRSGVYGNWHPPVMSWLLGLSDALHPGASLFMLGDTALLYGGLLSLLFLPARPHWAFAAIAAAALVTPQWLLYPGIVWKDVLFATSAVAGFLSLAHAATQWTHPRRRFVLLAASLVFLVLAVLARQNGLVLIPVAAVAFGWIASQQAPARKVATGLLYGIAAFVVLLVVGGCGYVALATRVTGASSPLSQIGFLQSYDLAGAVADDPNIALDQIHDDDPALERLMRSDAARLYTPQRNDTLATSAPLQKELANVDDLTIPLQWRAVVLNHPLLYLRIRWDAFRWVFFTPDGIACRPAYAGVFGPPQDLRRLGLAPRFDARDRLLTAYTLFFVGSPVLSHAAYAAVALALIVLLLRRRRPADIAMAGLLAGMVLFALSFFVISIACDYRYLFGLDAAALVSLAYAMREGPSALLRRPQP